MTLFLNNRLFFSLLAGCSSDMTVYASWLCMFGGWLLFFRGVNVPIGGRWKHRSQSRRSVVLAGLAAYHWRQFSGFN